MESQDKINESLNQIDVHVENMVKAIEPIIPDMLSGYNLECWNSLSANGKKDVILNLPQKNSVNYQDELNNTICNKYTEEQANF